MIRNYLMRCSLRVILDCTTICSPFTVTMPTLFPIRTVQVRLVRPLATVMTPCLLFLAHLVFTKGKGG